MSTPGHSAQEFAIALAAVAYSKRLLSAEQFRKVVCHAVDVETCERLLKDEAALSDDDLDHLHELIRSASQRSTVEMIRSHTISSLQNSVLEGLPDVSTMFDDSGHREAVRYQKIREHAKGGLGQIWIAEDQEVKRHVALKEIREEHKSNVAGAMRFLQEGRITGQLEHPGIVPVYGLGRHPDGSPYYAMRFIQGQSFKEAVDEARKRDDIDDRHYTRGVDFQRLLRSFLTACQAIEYAHSRGVIHRDIKPENIMLGEFGETLLVDWGLAKVLGQAEDSTEEAAGPPMSLREGCLNLTMPESFLGTPAYMSPEQARREHVNVGKRSDIYSLGATLYYLLAGKPPVAPPSVTDMKRRLGFRPKSNERELWQMRFMLDSVGRGDFKRPSERDLRVPSNLEQICLKAMALDPNHRYQEIGEMVDELEQFFTDQPLVHWQTAIKRFRELVANFPDENEFLAALARAMVNAGGVLASMQRFDDALNHFKEALPHFELLLMREPDKTEYIREIAVTHNSISRALIRMNDVRGAVSEYKRARSVVEQYLESRGCDSDPEIAVLLLEPDQCGFVRLRVRDSD